MKAIAFSPTIYKQLQELRHKDQRLFRKIQKQLALFQQNPKHKSLRLHKLKGNLQGVWSISIDMNFRMLYKEDEEIYFFDMGTHDEVYRK